MVIKNLFLNLVCRPASISAILSDDDKILHKNDDELNLPYDDDIPVIISADQNGCK